MIREVVGGICEVDTRWGGEREDGKVTSDSADKSEVLHDGGERRECDENCHYNGTVSERQV